MFAQIRKILTRACLSGLICCSCLGCNCKELKKEAEKLYENANACSEGYTCTVVFVSEIAGVSPGCLSLFYCGIPINADVDQEQFGKEIKEIIEDYEGCDQICSIPDCIGPEGLDAVCNTEKGRCESFTL